MNPSNPIPLYQGVERPRLRRELALCGFCKCSHINEYATLVKTLHALADGMTLVFQHPVRWMSGEDYGLGGSPHIG